jgi:putative MATE family efflux protein
MQLRSVLRMADPVQTPLPKTAGAQSAKLDAKTFLGEEPIWALLRRLSVPAVIGMLVNALYNFVDTIFVGQGVGPLAIAALSIAFPIQMLIGAFAQMFGVGSASIISRRLGENRDSEAASAAGTALTAAVLFAVVITFLGLLLINPILSIFGATEQILPYAHEYFSVILIGAVFITVAMVSNNIIRAEGKAKTAMFIMIIGAGLNLVLDPIFIFALGMGVRGAATATVISQAASAFVAVRFFVRRQSMLPLRLRSFIINFRDLAETAALGFSVFVRQSGTSIMALTVNNMLRIHGGDMAIAAYGMITRLMMFLFMPIFGIVQGFQPIAGYNYGARRMDRVKEVVWKAIIVATLFSLLGFALIMGFPRYILSIFTTDEAALSIAVPALRTILMLIPLLGLQVVGATFFQSIGKAVPAFLLGLSRQFILLIPLLLILPGFFGLAGVWYAFPIADSISAAITALWLLAGLRKMCRDFDEKQSLLTDRPANRC